MSEDERTEAKVVLAQAMMTVPASTGQSPVTTPPSENNLPPSGFFCVPPIWSADSEVLSDQGSDLSTSGTVLLSF